MESIDCINYLEVNELPPCLNFNINKTETFDYNKINYNDYTLNIVRQKRHKYLLKLPFYDDYLIKVIEVANSEKPIKQLNDLNIIELTNDLNNRVSLYNDN
jgi:hypothetical protein